MEGELHRCNPLAAWITVSQCERNANRAKRATRRDERSCGEMHLVDHCLACPGVLARGEGTRYFPQLLAREAPEPKRIPRRRAPVAAIHASGWKPPDGTVTVNDLERMTGRPRRAIYRMLQHRKITPTVLGRAGRPACYPKEPALEAARAS